MTEHDPFSIEQLQHMLGASASTQLPAALVQDVNSSTLAIETLQFLAVLLAQIKPRTILEFGSGLSTRLFAGALHDQPQSRLISVDHSAYYLGLTRQNFVANEQISFHHAPLQRYKFGGKWFVSFDPSYTEAVQEAGELDLVLIDGPPGFAFGREAPLYQIAPWLSEKTLVLLDDSNRPPEQEAIANWQRFWGSALTVRSLPKLKKGLSVITIDTPGPRPANGRFGFAQRLGSMVRSWQVMRQYRRSDQYQADMGSYD